MQNPIVSAIMIKIDYKFYCINCGKEIERNINFPFCIECQPYSQESTFRKIKGTHCHYCNKTSDYIDIILPFCKECRLFDENESSNNIYYIQTLKLYKGMEENERKKLKPIWTDYQNATKIIELLELVKAKKLKIKDVFDNEPCHNKRTLNILKGWGKGIAFNPPIISHNKSLGIIDGRHRILAAYFLGVDSIPIILK